MPGGEALEHAGEEVAEGLIAKAAKGWLKDAIGPAGWQAARDLGETGAKDLGEGAGKTFEHVGEKSSYEFNMVENPGPLAEDEFRHAASNFAGGRYDREVTDHDMVLFRAGKEGNEFGQYFSEDPPVGELQSRIDNAVERYWLTPDGRYDATVTGKATSVLDTGYALYIPKGTTIYRGPVASRGGILVGGAKDQIYIHHPWDVAGLHGVDKWPLAPQ